MDKLESKILGCLVGGAAGDALGAATEVRTRKQIVETFGGYVSEFLAPPDDTFARGNRAGQITDDFSCAYIACEEIIENGGQISPEVGKRALLRWAGMEQYFERFAGPTTRASVERLRGTAPVPEKTALRLVNENGKGSNGAAMKAAPIALFSGGDRDKAISDVITMCVWTHPNNLSLSGAAAVAAAVAAAMQEHATLSDVVRAGIYGARVGERRGCEIGDQLAGPSVERRIQLAALVATLSRDLDSAIDNISDYIGSGLMAAESVPAAFGLMTAAGGRTKDAILAAVNIGSDTDTVATIVGGILGALNGIESMPPEYLTVIEAENDINLRQMAKQIRSLL